VIWKNYFEGSESNEEIAATIAVNITTDINHIRQNGDIKVGVHSITAVRRSFYIAAAPTIPVTVNKIIECSALVNTGAKLNIMTINVTDRAGLTIKTRIKVKIALYSEYINRFLEIIENILISVDLIVYRVNIFVTRSAPQSFILKIAYLHSARA